MWVRSLGQEDPLKKEMATHSSVAACDSMDCSTPGLPGLHRLPECAQTDVRRVGDAIQPSHPLSSPSPLPSVFPSIRVFSNESLLRIKWPKYWSFSFSISPSSEYSGLISFKIDWLDLLAVQGTLKSLLQHHSSKASVLHLSWLKDWRFNFSISPSNECSGLISFRIDRFDLLAI